MWVDSNLFFDVTLNKFCAGNWRATGQNKFIGACPIFDRCFINPQAQTKCVGPFLQVAYRV